MAENSKIEWTDHTANLWHGCTKVHLGCDNCYAEATAKRWGNDVWGNDKPRKEIKSFWKDLFKYQKKAAQANEYHKVFIGSMMDIFEKPMPLINSKGEKLSYSTHSLRSKLFSEIDLDMYPNLVFLFLTKRPSNINKYIPEHWKTSPPQNVMFGTSPVDQLTFEKLTRQLLKVSGYKFLSIEPQLTHINIRSMFLFRSTIHWIIQGGESGQRKRPFNLLWAKDMVNACNSLNIPYFFKQIDKVQEIPTDLKIRQFPRNLFHTLKR